MPIFRRLTTRAIEIGLPLLLVLAVLLLAIRFVLPYADRARETVEQSLSQRLGYQVAIGRLTVKLAGWDPQLGLQTVTLTDPRTRAPVLSLREMDLGLVLSASLRTLSPRFDALTLVGARLEARRTSDGHLTLVGLGALGGDDPQALATFLDEGRLALRDCEVRLTDDRVGGVVARITALDLTLDNRDRRHRAELSARLARPSTLAEMRAVPDAPAQPGAGIGLHLIADLSGQPSAPLTWSGTIYGRLDGTGLGRLVPDEFQRRMRFDQGSAHVEVWGRLDAGHLEQALARIDLADLALMPVTGTRSGTVPTSVANLSAMARLRPSSAGWQLQVADITARIDDTQVSTLDLGLRLTPEGQLAGLDVTADLLDLGGLPRAFTAWQTDLPEPLAALLRARPRGQLHGLAFSGNADSPGRPWRWTAKTRVTALACDATTLTPGFGPLDADLTADQGGGHAGLRAREATLALRPLFSEPIPIGHLDGTLDWQHTADGTWQLSGRDLVLGNTDLEGQGQFDLTLPANGGEVAMDLTASFHDADAAATRTYLPVGVMPHKLVSWLEDAIVSGRVTHGEIEVHGPLVHYPFRHGEGRFVLNLEFEDLQLDYQQGWPPIESATGRLRFLNQGLTIQVDRGRIYGSQLSAAQTVIPETKGTDRLLIHGETLGPFADARRILIETPLAKTLGRLGKVLTVDGTSRLVLDIDLPLADRLPLGVSGRLSWPQRATLGIADTPVALSALSGAVDFTEQSISAKSVTAQLWGQPVQIGIATRNAGNPNSSVTRIEARSATPLAELARRHPSALWQSVAGTLGWHLTLDLPNRDINRETVALDYHLASDLKGVAIDLPAPLGKSPRQSRTAELSGTFTPDRSTTLTGLIGDLGLALTLRPKHDPGHTGAVAGRLRLGASAVPPPNEHNGLLIDGTLKTLDLQPWLTRLADGGTVPGRRSGKARQNRTGVGALPPLEVQLNVGRLVLGDLHLTKTVLGLQPHADGQTIQVRANELAGDIHLPAADSTPLGIQLERLDLRAIARQLSPADQPAPVKGSRERVQRVPSLDLRVEDLNWGDIPLGTLDIALRKQTTGLALSHLTLSGRGMVTAYGEGGWTRSGSGGQSRLDITLSAPDLGKLFHALDDKSIVKAEDARATLNLTWPGDFRAFSLQQASGIIDLGVGKGQLLEVEPGLGRVLGFLNFGTLSRRLALDFSDLFGEGFAFEKVEGHIRIDDGKADFQRFHIDGVAGKVVVSGQSDLTAERFDQQVTVEPRLAAGVALASAVAGGPVVGATVYLVDRVAGNPIDRLGRYRYTMTGPWGNPELRPLGWDPEVKGVPKFGLPSAPDKGSGQRPNHLLDLD